MSNVKIILLGDARDGLPYAPIGFYYAKRFRANGHTSMSRTIVVKGARIRVVLKPDGHDKVFIDAFNGVAIFGFGAIGGVGYPVSMTNLVSNTGIVATDTMGVGTMRNGLAAAPYGGDRAIFGYGYNGGPTNLVSNTGVVATDTARVGLSKTDLAAAGYGGDRAIFGYGRTTGSGAISLTNKVSNTGVVATDTTGVGSSRHSLAAAEYGGDKAIFGFGNNGGDVSITNLVSNTGVVATDTTGVGSRRFKLAAVGYGGDRAFFGFGDGSSLEVLSAYEGNGVLAHDPAERWRVCPSEPGGFEQAFVPATREGLVEGGVIQGSTTPRKDRMTVWSILTTPFIGEVNQVSNTGVVAADVRLAIQGRKLHAGAEYGGDKAIFGFGYTAESRDPPAAFAGLWRVGTDFDGYVVAPSDCTGGDALGAQWEGAPSILSVTNKISNTGGMSSDTAGVGTARYGLAGTGFK